MEIILGIVSLIGLIVFFVIAQNISDIKSILREKSATHAHVEYFKHLAAGNNKEAHEALLYLFFNELEKTQSPISRKRVYEELKEGYLSAFTNLGFDYPEYR